MKKTYISPAMLTVQLGTVQMMAQSLDINTTCYDPNDIDTYINDPNQIRLKVNG